MADMTPTMTDMAMVSTDKQMIPCGCFRRISPQQMIAMAVNMYVPKHVNKTHSFCCTYSTRSELAMNAAIDPAVTHIWMKRME